MKHSGITSKAVLRELDASWEALKQNHLTTPKFSRKAVKTTESKFLENKLGYRGQEELAKLKSLMTAGGNTAKPADKVYTGNKMLGVSTLHKSNSIPVFSNEEIIDIARMRR